MTLADDLDSNRNDPVVNNCFFHFGFWELMGEHPPIVGVETDHFHWVGVIFY